MRKTNKEATSVFEGVSLSKGRWLAQYRKAGFYQRFGSEMEAFAHFIRVFVEFNGRGKASTKVLGRNPAWLGRTPIEELGHHGQEADGARYFQFPIDRQSVVRLDEEDYERYRSLYWFIKDGRIATVSGYTKDGDKFHFEYHFLDSVIYANASERVCIHDPPVKLDGNEFNLVRRNLAAPIQVKRVWQEDLGLADPFLEFQKRISFPPGWLRQRELYEEESWLASLQQNKGETSDQPPRGSEVIIPGEQSEPGM